MDVQVVQREMDTEVDMDAVTGGTVIELHYAAGRFLRAVEGDAAAERQEFGPHRKGE